MRLNTIPLTFALMAYAGSALAIDGARQYFTPALQHKAVPVSGSNVSPKSFYKVHLDDVVSELVNGEKGGKNIRVIDPDGRLSRKRVTAEDVEGPLADIIAALSTSLRVHIYQRDGLWEISESLPYVVYVPGRLNEAFKSELARAGAFDIVIDDGSVTYRVVDDKRRNVDEFLHASASRLAEYASDAAVRPEAASSAQGPQAEDNDARRANTADVIREEKERLERSAKQAAPLANRAADQAAPAKQVASAVSPPGDEATRRDQSKNGGAPHIVPAAPVDAPAGYSISSGTLQDAFRSIVEHYGHVLVWEVHGQNRMVIDFSTVLPGADMSDDLGRFAELVNARRDRVAIDIHSNKVVVVKNGANSN